MTYVDALLDKKNETIHVVERVNGKRIYKEYPIDYTFYYDDPKGQYKSIFGTPISKASPKNSKDFQRDLKVYSGKKLWEADMKPVVRCLSSHYLGKNSPNLQTAFFDIEVDMKPYAFSSGYMVKIRKRQQ